MGNEYRLRNTSGDSGGNKASVFSVAGCVFGRTMVRQLPGEDVEGWEPCHPCFTRPLCWLYCAVELVAVYRHPNGDRFGSKSLGVVAWGKGRGVVVGQAQCRRGQPVVVEEG